MTTKMEKSKDVKNAPQPIQVPKLSQEFINWYNDPLRVLSFEVPQSIGSGLESDVENNVSDTGTTNEAPSIGKYDSTIDDNLPPTVTLLTTPEGGKLYLVGTAHFSVESQNDVSKIIRAVQPSIVMIELCKHRIHALHLDEEALLKESENIGIEDIRTAIKKHGVTSGLMFIVLLSMSRHVTKELGMAPGSEFRTAFAEAAKVPNCIVHLGDRPFNITMQRAFRALSFWQKIKCGWKLLSSREPITKEDVEKCKNRETLDAVIEELATEFPPLAEVMVKERDLFLTYSLQLACQPRMTNEGTIVPTRAVGVVGIGHMPGIIKNWGKVHASQIQPIMKIPPRALSSKIISFTVKASFIGTVIYVGYKTIPLPSIQTLESLKSSVKGLLKLFTEASLHLLWLFRRRAITISMAVKNSPDEYNHLTSDIMYTECNIPGPGIDIDEFESEFTIGCECQNECLAIKCPCIHKTRNYINDCLVDEKLGPIVECNSHCSCGENCGNKLVQKGPLNCLTVVKSEGRGLGLSTTGFIKKGQFICEYAGEVIEIEEAKRRFEENRKSMNYVIVISEYVGEKMVTTCIDPKYFGNIGRYCNHSCEPNAKLVPVRVEKASPRVCLFASKDIKPGEEITFHYAEGVDTSVQNLSETPCRCGSSTCLRYLPHHSV